MDLEVLLQGIDNCGCGKKHPCPIDYVKIGKGVLSSLPTLCGNYKSILLVSDQNTYRVCAEKVEVLLGNKITSQIMFETGDAPLIPNEEAIAAIHKMVIPSVDLILGVGSGVINDLCKIVSFERNRWHNK